TRRRARIPFPGANGDVEGGLAKAPDACAGDEWLGDRLSPRPNALRRPFCQQRLAARIAETRDAPDLGQCCDSESENSRQTRSVPSTTRLAWRRTWGGRGKRGGAAL